MMPQEDQHQDADMIKTILQKIIDEMNTIEADRIMPEDRKPKIMAAKVDVMSPETMEGEPENEDGLDPAVLKDLLDKAGQADESGSMPEDRESDLPPEIRDAVNRRKEPGFYAGSDGVQNPTEDAGETIDEAEPENQRNQHPKLTPTERKTTLEHTEGNDSASRSTSDFMGLSPAMMDAARNKKR